ncbi:MAG TPA: DUF4160 domain-containing protein [Opitutae bacterium]|nr:DUF4160 domain-containing protein [Opitutae bacterium]
MSPTVFYHRNYRFFFFSREESRMHIHIYSPSGEAKFWIEPKIELAVSKGLNSRELKEVETQVKEHENEIRREWNKHFGST